MICAETNHEPSNAETVGRSAGRVMLDLLVLAELQWQLGRSDARQWVRQWAPAAATLAGAILLLLAAVPIALAAVALALAAAGLPLAAAFGLVAVLALAAVGAMALWVRHRLGKVSAAFACSRQELARNVEWFKAAIGPHEGDADGAPPQKPR
jgi:hypothetical protein